MPRQRIESKYPCDCKAPYLPGQEDYVSEAKHYRQRRFQRCSRCGTRDSLKWVEFDNTKNSVRIYQEESPGWVLKVKLKEPPVSDESGKPYCEMCVVFKGYYPSGENQIIRESLGVGYECPFCPERRRIVSQYLQQFRELVEKMGSR